MIAGDIPYVKNFILKRARILKEAVRRTGKAVIWRSGMQRRRWRWSFRWGILNFHFYAFRDRH